MPDGVPSPRSDVPVMDVVLNTPETAADPWPMLKRIRDAGPLVWNRRGHWMTAHDKICRQILTKPGSLGQGGAMSAFFGNEAFISIDEKAPHDALRNVWMTAFRRDTLLALAPTIRKFCKQLLDAAERDLRAGKDAEMMSAFCRPLPAYVIASMMGIPDDMLAPVVRWSDDMSNAAAGGFPIDYDNDPHWLAADKAKKELAAYLFAQLDYRRSHPSDDLISQIVNSDVGKTLSEEALMVNTRQLLFAGNETTTKWLGHIIVILGRRPDLRRELMEHPELLPAALDEIMRWEPVVHTMPRNVRGHEAVVAGIPLQDGAEVILLLGGANRDPERYPDPDRLDIYRERKANLGFGYGLHSCLGVTLAQLEAQVSTTELLARFPDYIVREPVHYPDFIMRGPAPLHIARS